MTWLGTFEGAPLGEPSVRKRWMRGAAVYGKSGDRFVLVEKVLSSTCDAPDVSYILIDTATRMLFPLGKLAGGGARIHRHDSGLGFVAVPPPSPDGSVNPKQIRSIVFDAEAGTFERARGKATGTVAEQLAARGFAALPLAMPGEPLRAYVERPDAHCKTLADAGIKSAVDHSAVFHPDAPGQRWSCNVGDGHHMLLGRDGSCGGKVSIMLTPPEGETLVLYKMDADDGPRRVVVHDASGFPGARVEVGTESGASADLVPVNIDYMNEEVVRGAALAVRPPPSARPARWTTRPRLECGAGKGKARVRSGSRYPLTTRA